MRSAKIDAFSSPGPTADEICRQVERILTSEEFHAPKRGRNFLEFVVNETLAGRSSFLKAFTIANLVFDRKASFDPQNDPVVRIEAGRIRKALERYYLVAGQADQVIITVPKGGYVPHFEYARGPSSPLPALDTQKPPTAEAETHAHPAWKTPRSKRLNVVGFGIVLAALVFVPLVLAVVHFFPRDMRFGSLPPAASGPRVTVGFFAGSNPADDGWDITHGLRDDTIGQLAQFTDIVVVADPLRSETGADFALQGNVQLDGSRLRVAARLVRQADGAVVWANNFDADLLSENRLALQADMARKIAGAIAQPYGALFQAGTGAIARPALRDDQDSYACTLAYDSYRQSMSAQTHDAVRECLQQATERFPDRATSWALLSMVYLDEMRFRYKLGGPDSSRSLQLATEAVARATALAPGNPRVLQALMMVSFFEGDIGKALKAGTAAYAANPGDTEVAGEYGLRLAMSGKWQSGCELLSIALDRHGGPEGYYEVGMALCALMKGDVEAAEQWSRRSDLGSNPMHHLVLLSILGAAGKLDEARLERNWLAVHAPALVSEVRKEVALRLQRPEDQEQFLNGLRASGLAIGLPPDR